MIELFGTRLVLDSLSLPSEQSLIWSRIANTLEVDKIELYEKLIRQIEKVGSSFYDFFFMINNSYYKAGELQFNVKQGLSLWENMTNSISSNYYINPVGSLEWTSEINSRWDDEHISNKKEVTGADKKKPTEQKPSITFDPSIEIELYNRDVQNIEDNINNTINKNIDKNLNGAVPALITLIASGFFAKGIFEFLSAVGVDKFIKLGANGIKALLPKDMLTEVAEGFIDKEYENVKNNVMKSIRNNVDNEFENSAKGLIGQEFENYLEKELRGKGSFKVGGREFDGCKGDRWWEAKSEEYWNMCMESSKKLARFKEDMGDRKRIAKNNGATYELFSNTPIPQPIKDWLAKKGISYTEILK